MPTIAVSDDIKRKLNEIKNLEQYKNVNEILENMIILYQKTPSFPHLSHFGIFSPIIIF